VSDVDPTRRAVLLAAGMGVGLLGVGAVADRRDGAPSVTYDRDALDQVVGLGEPVVPQRAPVRITPAHVARHRERARSLLASAPARPDIPNDAVAREYADRYESAVDALARADEAPTPSERIRDLRSARWFAAEVAATYAAFADGLTTEAVLARREPVRERLAAFRDRWRYVGDDPTVAVAVHHEVESAVDYADGRLDAAAEQRGDDGSRVLAVGSTAGDIELARAALADATYRYDRFRDELSERRLLGPAFDRAARALTAAVAAGCPDSPDADWTDGVDRDLSNTAGKPLVEGAVAETAGRCRYADEAREREGVASAVLAAGAADRDRRALDAVRTAVRGGKYGVPRAASRVRREKLDALAAVERAREATPTHLAAGWTATAARTVGRGDDVLSRPLDRGDVDVRDVARAVAEYAWGRARAAATPPALARLTGALDAAGARET
jgi:hypothetical protein